MVLDAGTVGGVDAAAVEDALIDPEQVPWPTVDGRLNCFARLTLAEMTEAAEAAVAPPPETEGDADLGVDNVLFSCATHRWGDLLVIPYAGADSRIFGATLPFAALVEALEARATAGA